MAKCCMCDVNVDRESAPVLSMGAVGNPRFLCDRCAGLLDTATLGEDFDTIKDAIEEIGTVMADNDPDEVTFSIVSELMLGASERAKAIRDGSYDFSLDTETKEGELEDIPEELLESEEDIEKDKADEEKLKKFDKFYNYVLIGAGIAAAIFVIWKVLEGFGVDFSRFFDIF